MKIVLFFPLCGLDEKANCPLKWAFPLAHKLHLLYPTHALAITIYLEQIHPL